MVQYVYARHDFMPEHEDEISFRAGERIEVVETDDGYSDGWWQVRFALYSSSLKRVDCVLPSRARARPSPVLMAFLRRMVYSKLTSHAASHISPTFRAKCHGPADGA